MVRMEATIMVAAFSALALVGAAIALALLVVRKAASSPRGKLLLVIAHPDDESMFFVPTCAGFASKRILCLSNGNYDGLGKIREKELHKAADVLGFESVVIKDFPDGPKEIWDEQAIAEIVRQEYTGPDETIVTFDERGVSGHANHISVYNGVKRFAKETPQASVYKLASDGSILLKYSGVIGAAIECIYNTPKANDNALLLVNPDLSLTYQAMSAHYSQFVWFRGLFILFARCTMVNRLEHI